jgi:hypothetical protein
MVLDPLPPLRGLHPSHLTPGSLEGKGEEEGEEDLHLRYRHYRPPLLDYRVLLVYLHGRDYGAGMHSF